MEVRRVQYQVCKVRSGRSCEVNVQDVIRWGRCERLPRSTDVSVWVT
jgi:hypothetical protein